MPRPSQFSLRWLFVAMLVVAAFFGGMEAGRRHERRQIDWEHKAMTKELGELRDCEMADAYIIAGVQRLMTKHGIDKSELEEAIGSLGASEARSETPE